MGRGKSVIVVGGGAFGVSTAWHLSRDLGKEGSKYSSIQVLDRFPPPSQVAAATDINKIIRTEYSDPVYTQLATAALQAWTDPEAIFHKHFHRTGWLLCARGGSNSSSSVSFVDQSAQHAHAQTAVRFMTPAEVRSTWPVFNGPMAGWKILSDPDAGWAAAGKILLEMAEQSAGRGVFFASGDAGQARELLFDDKGERCVGVRTVDGTTYYADHVVLAAGANTASLVDMEGQQDALGHTVCFIRLSPAEAQRYRHMTLMANIEEGCIFPPDENNVVKIASVHFVSNFKSSRVPGISLPRFREDHPGDDVPDAIQRRLRHWIREVMPELADRPWSETRICWEAQTPTDDFIIANHPRYSGLVVATGGSGHAFKFLPTLGIYVSQLLEGTLSEELEAKWRWTSPSPTGTMSTSRSSATPMFAAPVRDLADFPGWQTPSARL